MLECAGEKACGIRTSNSLAGSPVTLGCFVAIGMEGRDSVAVTALLSTAGEVFNLGARVLDSAAIVR